jgi:hypothetical protein
MRSKAVPSKQKFQISNLKFYAGGFLITELVVALTVLGIVLAGFAISLHNFAQFNNYQLVRHRCISAAQAQLDSIAATGQAVTDEDFQRLWPQLTVSIKKSPGTGQWEGLELVEVTTKAVSFRNKVKVQLSRYILAGKTQLASAPVAEAAPATEPALNLPKGAGANLGFIAGFEPIITEGEQ